MALWLESHVAVTGSAEDYVLLADLHARFGAGRPGGEVGERIFNRLARAALCPKPGVSCKEPDNVVIDGRWRAKRGVIRGAWFDNGAVANTVAAWLDERVAVTGNLDDVVVLSDLRQMYQQVRHERDEFKARLFDRPASAHLVQLGAVKSQKTEQVAMRSGEVKITKGVFRGVAYRDILPHGP